VKRYRKTVVHLSREDVFPLCVGQTSHPIYVGWQWRNGAMLEVFVTLYFRLQISISCCSFCSQLMNCWNSRKLWDSRFRWIK